MSVIGAAPPYSNVPPSAGADVALSDGRTLHARELPLARMGGVLLDGARFDTSGTRVAFLASFPASTIGGDWRRTDPTQAYVVDIVRRSLLALTADGRANAIRWTDAAHVRIVDGGAATTVALAPPASPPNNSIRVAAIAPATSGALVTPPEEFRLQALKTSAQSYAIGQVGAVRLRTIAVAPNGAYAVVGSFVVWIDGARSGGPPIARSGPDDILAPAFADNAYARTLTSIAPLGHVVYQGSYRNGTAYFAFSYGLERIVAATSDFVAFSFPALPKDPVFTVGDGLGAGADGSLYFAAPEAGRIQYWHGGRYIDRALRLPDDASDAQRLEAAMTRLTPGDALWPPMRPDADALDASALEWRVYPVGDATGDRWIASHLGRMFVAGGDMRLREYAAPGFPFVVLGRTDDGRIWGATPQRRVIRGPAIVSAESRLFFSRDGLHWSIAAMLPGDPGAVGMRDGALWVAMSVYEGDANGVEVLRVGDAPMKAAPTGAIYTGEDMFFADLDSGWYLVCGGQPGTRRDDAAGPLVAVRLDSNALFSFDKSGLNAALAQRLDPLRLGAPSEPSAFVAPSVRALAALASPYRPTLVSQQPAAVASMRSLSFDAERQFEVEYAWRPYPLATVAVSRDDNAATVRRDLERGPLAIAGQVERWTRDSTGRWRLSSIVSRWKI